MVQGVFLSLLDQLLATSEISAIQPRVVIAYKSNGVHYR